MDTGVQKKYKLAAPDGGYGYVIMVAVVIVYITTTGFATIFGMLYNKTMIEMGMGSTSLTVMNGINGISMSISGYATGPLLKILSLRNFAYLGSIVFSLGYIGLLFSHTAVTFCMSQAILCAGAGSLFNISTTLLNDYFERKRLLSISLTQTVTALVAMLMPLFIKFTLEEYGYRGTLIIILGVSVQNFFACTLIHPVSRHMQKVLIEESVEEEKLIVTKGELVNENETIVKMTINDDKKTDNLELTNSDHDGKENDEIPGVKNRKGILQRVSDIMDLSLFKNYYVMSACLGVSMSLFADLTFAMMLPQALYAQHFDEQTVALALTLCGFGDLVARISQTLFSKCLSKINYKVIYMFGLALACSTRMAMLWTKSRIMTLVLITITGVSKCAIATLIPLVLSASVEQARFPGAMGVFMVVFGVFGLIVGPLVGSVRDLTQSYSACFSVLNTFFLIVILFWSIEICYMRSLNNTPKVITVKTTNKGVK